MERRARSLIKPGGISLSRSLFLSPSAGRAKYGVERCGGGKGGKQWEITLVYGIIVHAFRRVTARSHRWSRLRRNAQRRPLTCGPCVRRCSPNACVHASPTTADFSPTSYTRSKIKKTRLRPTMRIRTANFILVGQNTIFLANNKISSISIRSVFSFFRDLYFRETSKSSQCATLDSLYVIDSDLYIHL